MRRTQPASGVVVEAAYWAACVPSGTEQATARAARWLCACRYRAVERCVIAKASLG